MNEPGDLYWFIDDNTPVTIRMPIHYGNARLLRQAGVLEVQWDRARKMFVPVTLELFPLAEQENKTRQKYLEKLQRLCVLMRRMNEEDEEDGMSTLAIALQGASAVAEDTLLEGADRGRAEGIESKTSAVYGQSP